MSTKLKSVVRDVTGNVVEMLSRWRQGWRESGIGRIETLCLIALSIGLFIGASGFFFGKTCSGMPMILGWLVAGVGAMWVSWKHGLTFFAVMGGLLLLTMFTFSYTGPDTGVYHYPMQRLLIDGWNPVFESSIERFSALPSEGTYSLYHTLFLPKVSALCGALVAKTFGLFAGDALLGYVLVFVLWRVSARFAREQWECSRGVSHLFAATLALSTKVTSFLAGQVDYTAYAAFVAGILAFVTWRRTHCLGDIVLAALGMAFAMLAKSTGMCCGMLLVAIGFAMAWREAAYRWAVLGLAIFILVVGASPLLTAWIQYGSPFYSLMTFDPNVQPVDITADFVGNADGESMGYVARIVYAWFSETLACKGCALWYGQATFAPEFYVVGGVGGLGTFFNLMMWGSLVALAVSRKNSVFWLCIILFITGNLAPLKYIGYSRYFPQMWAIPFLAAFNLLYAPQPWVARWSRWARPFALAGVACFVVSIAARALAYQGRQFYMERIRQEAFEILATQSTQWKTGPIMYSAIKRIEAAGLTWHSTGDVPVLAYDSNSQMPYVEGFPTGEELSAQVPICNSIRQLFHFPWWTVVTHLPKPI